MSSKKFGKRLNSNASGHFDPNAGYHGNQNVQGGGYAGRPQDKKALTRQHSNAGRNPLSDRYDGGKFSLGIYPELPEEDNKSDISMYTKSLQMKKIKVLMPIKIN